MTPPIATTAFNLDTLERIDFPSMAKAADYCMVNKSMLVKYLRNDQMWRGWYWCITDQADHKTERVLYLSRRWKTESKPLARRRGPKCLVSLRIDRHTTILVPTSKATPEYAKIYKERLNQKPKH